MSCWAILFRHELQNRPSTSMSSRQTVLPHIGQASIAGLPHM